MIQNKNIDHNKAFDWGRTSADYGKYRDIYPDEFYQNIIDKGLCVKGQKVLDIGTGTGVIPRNLYSFGADFTGIDIAENQIIQARKLASDANMNIQFDCMPAEQIDFPEETFDVITACQCFAYFDHPVLAPHLAKMLKKGGKLVVMYMAWLPFDDAVAGASENLVLKYNPAWTGCKETRHLLRFADCYKEYFTIDSEEIFDVNVPFTRESWNGRMRSCRGIGASLPQEEIQRFDEEHMALLNKIAKPQFDVLHYCAVTVLKKEP